MTPATPYGAAVLFNRTGEQRVDNMKRWLSEGFEDVDPSSTPLPPSLNPTGTLLSYGDVIQLYLAFLTDVALSDLQAIPGVQPAGKDIRYVRRRFAMPCFTGRREIAARSWLRTAFLRAQIIADTLHGRWASNLKVSDLANLLDDVKNLPSLPEYLLASDAAVKEPIAAVATRVEDYLDGRAAHRLPIMVVDAGAGTTDFAVFYVQRLPGKDESRIFTVSPTVDFTTIAGNRVDSALREHILETNSTVIGPTAMTNQDWELVRSDLDNRIRRLKESVVRDGEAELSFSTGQRIKVLRSEFFNSRSLTTLRKELEAKQEDVLSKLGDDYFADMKGREQFVLVLLTGGTSNVPLFQQLANRSIALNGVDFRLRSGGAFPQWIEATEYASLRPNYPQLAVAIGGAANELPEDLEEPSRRYCPTPARRADSGAISHTRRLKPLLQRPIRFDAASYSR